jgi:hypothetical protein
VGGELVGCNLGKSQRVIERARAEVVCANADTTKVRLRVLDRPSDEAPRETPAPHFRENEEAPQATNRSIACKRIPIHSAHADQTIFGSGLVEHLARSTKPVRARLPILAKPFEGREALAESGRKHLGV